MYSAYKLNKQGDNIQPWCTPAAAAKSLQSCLTLCDPIDSSPPGPAIPGILQARTLEWVAISFSNAWKWKVKVKSLSRVQLFATPWTAAYQAPPPMGFSRQEYWSGVPLPSLMIYSAYKLNKQGDNMQPWYTPFPIWNQSVVPCPVLTVASWPAYRFLKRQVRWSSIPISFRIFHSLLWSTQGFPGGSDGKVSACNAGDLGSIPGLGRFPGGENSNPFQYSFLENTMDGGFW